jgi:hypothetical protein
MEIISNSLKYNLQFIQLKQRIVNFHGTLYSKSIFPRINERFGFDKPTSVTKWNQPVD